jgi:hemolysin III
MAPVKPGRQIRPSGTDTSPRGRGWLHFGALLVALPAASALVVRDPTGAGVSCYAAALVGLYAVSAAYHLLPLSPGARRRMRQLDHSMIYVFIAGTYAPLCLLVAGGNFGRIVLALAVLGAAGGVLITWTGLEQNRRVGGALYIVIGWLALVMLPRALHVLDASELALLGSMGILYTAGAGVLASRWPDPFPETFGYHEVWHAMVVVASGCSFAVVWSLAGPHP